MNRIRRLAVAATTLAVAVPALADAWGDSKPVLHTLRATSAHAAAAVTAPAPGWKNQDKPVLWSRHAPSGELTPAEPPSPHFGQKLAIHTLIRM